MNQDLTKKQIMLRTKPVKTNWFRLLQNEQKIWFLYSLGLGLQRWALQWKPKTAKTQADLYVPRCSMISISWEELFLPFWSSKTMMQLLKDVLLRTNNLQGQVVRLRFYQTLRLCTTLLNSCTFQPIIYTNKSAKV